MSWPDWATAAGEVAGVSGILGVAATAFRSGRSREAFSRSQELIEILEKRHSVDQEALKAAALKERQYEERISALEAQVKQLQTVSEIAAALRTLAESMRDFRTTNDELVGLVRDGQEGKRP